MQAIDVALAISAADRVNALGFCVAARCSRRTGVMAAKGRRQVREHDAAHDHARLRDTGELSLLVSEQSVAAQEAAIGQGG